MLAHLESKQRPAYVLVVEDEALIRILIAEELRTAGLSVIEASNADEAWSYATAGGPIDVLFSDFQMPGSKSNTSAHFTPPARRPVTVWLLAINPSDRKCPMASGTVRTQMNHSSCGLMMFGCGCPRLNS